MAATGLTGSGITALTVEIPEIHGPSTPQAVSSGWWSPAFKGCSRASTAERTGSAIGDGLGHLIGTSLAVTAVVVDSRDSNRSTWQRPVLEYREASMGGDMGSIQRRLESWSYTPSRWSRQPEHAIRRHFFRSVPSSTRPTDPP